MVKKKVKKSSRMRVSHPPTRKKSHTVQKKSHTVQKKSKKHIHKKKTSYKKVHEKFENYEEQVDRLKQYQSELKKMDTRGFTTGSSSSIYLTVLFIAFIGDLFFL